MSVEELLRTKRDEIRRIAWRHGAGNVRVFGSVARGEARTDSDVDFLIDVVSTPSSWFPAGLVLDLEGLLGRRVEVVTERALDANLRDQVLREAVPL
jgi:predicted nucleotidyltransferase